MRKIGRRVWAAGMVLSGFMGAPAFAGGAAEGDDAAELQGLLEVLEQQTEIATKTKLNADYVPGMVTVLHGEEMLALGARTVWDALRLVPGIEPSTDSIGARQILVRGIGGSFASGNMKILLNGRAMNSALSASANPVLNLSIAQVDHIEVVRGPGSAVHGEFAYAGVLNVITRKQGREVFLRAGESDVYAAGGFAHWRSEDGRGGGSLNVGGWHSAGAGTKAGRDALYNGFNASQSSLSNAPGAVDDEVEQRSVLLDLYRDALSLSLVYVEDGHGDHFGTINVLDTDQGVDYRNRYLMASGKGSWALTEHLSAELALGWQYYENRFNTRLLPNGFTWFNKTPALTVLPGGYVTKGYYEEQRLSADLDVHWDGWEGHRWLASLGLARISVGDSWQENNVNPATNNPTTTQRFFKEDGVPWPSEHRSRRIASFTVQDEYRLADNVTLTAGARYDDYDDFGSNTSPRLAAVWRLDRHHILKAQYAEAFRPPTFYETGFAPDLKPETIRTAELGYVFKSAETEARLTAFRSRLSNLIVNSGILGYINANAVRTHGAEGEIQQRFGPHFRIEANLTVVDTEQAGGGSVAGAANRLANLVLRYEPRSTHTYAMWLRHVGERGREASDSREQLSGYETVDLAASFGSLGVKGLTLRIGVSNLFDRDVRYPAFNTLDLAGQTIRSYTNDYPQPGRAGWLQLSYAM
ncbi:TonB-dependent receptor [Zoogloeaceae bacterium G21618-S1]|nr:TonB-dependent receptor [Zoogloeaceae bacterium G21618-S1]